MGVVGLIGGDDQTQQHTIGQRIRHSAQGVNRSQRRDVVAVANEIGEVPGSSVGTART
jgi:hypothetical protein